MPGPMGGSRGGGFGGGGARGGGSRGGGFGGGFGGGPRGPRGPMHHGPHHHHHHGPIFFGPMWHRPHYHGGGCFGGAISAFVIFIFSIVLIISVLASALSYEDDGGIVYDEQAFQTYANQEYYSAFSDTDNYEDNILIVFAVYEGYEEYKCIAWGGYDIDTEVSDLFGDYFRSVVNSSMPSYYEFALPSSFKSIVEKMTAKASSIIGEPTGEIETGFSTLINRTDLTIDKTTVNKALVEFTEKTGINISIVVADSEDIFGMEKGSNDLGAAFFVILIVIIAVIVIAFIKSKKNNGGNGNKNTADKTDPNAGQGRYDPNTGTWV